MKCITSFSSTGRENYNKALLRMIKSCQECGWDGGYHIRTLDGYVDEYMGVKIINGAYPAGCNNHAEVPYGFKPAIIKEAIDKGYEQVVWCDSTIKMMKDITPLLDYAKQFGVCAFDNLGYPLNGWISDIALERLQITEKDLLDIKQIMACCIIFDISNPVGKRIFNEWYEASKDGVSFQNGYGSSRRGFVAHRHDQAVLSGLLWKYKIELLPYGKLVYQPHDTTFEYGKDIYFLNKGV